jgi:hypothetical protein
MTEPPDAALFREPPESFVAARDALARRLRDGGDEEAAAAVKALRKPTVGAWAMNQLASRAAEGVRALLDAGAELRAAQQAALSSARDPERLRTAAATRRRTVDALVHVAGGVLAEAGRPRGSVLDEIRSGLETASIDPDAGARLEAGRFERPPEGAAGFGGPMAGLVSVPDAGEEPTGARTRKEPHTDVVKLRRDRDDAAQRAQAARTSSKTLARELARLEAQVEKTRLKHADATAQADAAQLELRRAEKALTRVTGRAKGR